MTANARTTQKVATRERLVATAYRLFARDGILATPTASVAAAAGVAHGTVFVHFPTRDDLVSAVIEEYTVRIAERMRQLALQAPPTLQAGLQAHVAAIQEQEAFYARLVTERPMLPAVARSRLLVLQSAIAYYFGQAIESEKRAGRLRAMPFALLFNTWLGLLHHYVCNPDLFAAGASVLADRGPTLVAHFLNLVRK
jgi:AcrR family transcriptional regulator